MLYRCVLLSCACVYFTTAVCAAPRYVITNLGVLDGNQSTAFAINETGGIVGVTDSPLGREGFLYRDGAMIGLGAMPGAPLREGVAVSIANDINDSFQIVGRAPSVDLASHAFLWEDGVMTDLGAFAGESQGWGINNQGLVVGRSATADFETHAFLYDGDRLIDLGTGGGKLSGLFEVNDAGIAVGYSETDVENETHAFIFVDGAAIDLGTLGGNSWAESINIHDQVTGSFTHADGDAHAFLYENGEMTDLGKFHDTSTRPYAINDDGWIVGAAEGSSVFGGAFLYANGAWHDLNQLLVNDLDSQWELIRANDINNQGQIVGRGNYDGQQRAFLLTPAVSGDANLDGMVDAADLNELALNWRSIDAEGWGKGDFTADGIVNAADLNELALNWQFGVDPVAAAHAVPEPFGIVLAVIGLLAFCVRRRCL